MTNSLDHAPMSATFMPGVDDNYHMPSSATVISPLPQRVLQNLSAQTQTNPVALQLNNSNVDPSQTPKSKINARNVLPQSLMQEHARSTYQSEAQSEYPKQSIFRLQNRTPNVPPSDEERESLLDNARIPILRAIDPEMQLNWAQDALNFLDATKEHNNWSPEPDQSRHIARQLLVDAVNIVNFLADQQHPRAEFLRGTWHEFGKFGTRMDNKKASACYQRAASKGHIRAEYRRGMLYEAAGEHMLALQHFVAGESQGDSASCYRMGMMALLGQFGQLQDFDRGIRLIRHAANTADDNAPQGAYVYGMLLARDLPQIEIPEVYLPLDLVGALHYVEKAAYLGFSKAQLKLGSAYELCSLGCDFNPALSLHYNMLAARQNEAEAELSLSKWFLCGFEGVFQKSDRIAYTYAERAAWNGLPAADFALGYYHEVGIYVPASVPNAIQWYKRAAAKGNPDAISRLEGISASRTLSRHDHDRVAVSRIKSRYGSMRGINPLSSSTDITMHQISQGREASPTPYPSDGHSCSTMPHLRPNSPSVLGLGRRMDQLNIRAEERSSAPAYFIRSVHSSSNIAVTSNDGAKTMSPQSAISSSLPVGKDSQRQCIPPTNHHSTSPPELNIPISTKTEPQLSSNILDIGFVAPPDPRFAEGFVKEHGQPDSLGRRLQKTCPPITASGRTTTSLMTTDTRTGQSNRPSKKKAGPQTFEQMGYANAKQESDCKVM